jgi:hypothetical protein
MEVARRQGQRAVQRPPAPARHAGQGHPAAPCGRLAQRRRRARHACRPGGQRRFRPRTPSRSQRTDQGRTGGRCAPEQDRDAAKQKEEERRLAAQRRENCSRAQAGLRDLQSGTRITRTNEKGERVFMDEAQIAAEVARARDVVSSECR